MDARHVIDFNKFKLLEGEPEVSPEDVKNASPQQMETFVKHYRRMQKFRGRFTDFVQVECGYKHTLLLNKKGQVFAFGEGLQGQLGLPSIGGEQPKKPIQQAEPQ